MRPAHTFIIFSYLSYVFAEDCWWTGCQPTAWAVTGCAQYDRVELEKRSCSGGHEFKCCAKTAAVKASAGATCWWTGCQLSSWAVTGCEQYERQEVDRRGCDGGNEFHCCPPEGFKTEIARPSSVPSESSRPTRTTGCWWTGCQSTSWAVTGCAQYDRLESGRKSCDGGFEYNCCPTGESTNSITETPKQSSSAGECWWTGCQLDSWKTKGCAQYYKTEIAQRNCDGGKEYHCCGARSVVKIPPKEDESSGGQNCWWTGCQLESWAVTGCAQYDKIEVGRKSCDGGNEFNCCGSQVEQSVVVQVTPPRQESSSGGAGESCWWTGCQLNNWAVTGCAQYDKVEVGRKSCDGGNEFHCCGRTIGQTNPEVVPPVASGGTGESCWWTGCQLSNWAVTGCAQYDKVEVGRKSCAGGNEFHCCGRTTGQTNPEVVPSVASGGTGESCWWTGCQLNNWAVTGCAQYDKVEVGRKSCDGGNEFHCCGSKTEQKIPEVAPPVSSGGTRESCWWTGCQLSNWAVTGCAQYDKVEVGRKSCDGGNEFHCCGSKTEQKISEVAPPVSSGGTGESCWWTGCQLSSWAVTGCAQYDKVEVARKSCNGGNEFHCCSSSTGVRLSPVNTPARPAESSGGQSCWWTGCQLNSWAVTGCAQYDRQEVDRRDCADGREYKCCASSVPDIPKLPTTSEIAPESEVSSEEDESCWWTGCQLSSWEVRGCDHYHRVERGRRPCEDGDQFKCCVRTSSDPKEVVKDDSKEEEKEEEEHCWRSPCLVDDGSYICPSQYILKKKNTNSCKNGKVIMHCCPPSNKRPTTCKLPYGPQNGVYFSYTCTHGDERPQCQYRANTLVEAGFDLHYKCNDGYTLHGRNEQYCTEKGWEPAEQPVCSDECQPLVSQELIVACYRWDRQRIACTEKMARGSYAVFRCPPTVFYQSLHPGFDTIVCQGGKWSSPLPQGICKATCGVAQMGEGELHIVNGVTVRLGALPWHAGIYHFNESSGVYDQNCGGTLVSKDAIITAAHCFKNQSGRYLLDISPKDKIRVTLGQLHREFNSPKDAYRQIFGVNEVIVNPDYTGIKDNFGDDIAIVILDRPVQYTASVLLACLDIGANNIEEDQLKRGAVGKVVGWGRIDGDGPASEVLLMGNMTYAPRDECLENTELLFNFITRDKICAIQDSSRPTTVCQGDSGGGYVFEDPKSRQFYLRGIVSVGSPGCVGDDYALFTRISKHAAWINQYVKN